MSETGLVQASWRARVSDYVALTRLDRPIGIYLLLWPTLWALWLAAEGTPDWRIAAIFITGVVLMRSAGCIINDYADRHLDPHVQRTEQRPLATGRISERAALGLFGVLIIVAFMLVLATNWLTVALAAAALLLAVSYPFFKRFTHWPQVVLGAAFGWAIPMAFAAQTGAVPAHAWLLFMANLTWTVAYDTLYAMVDRDDDVRIGIKSTAVLFGKLDLAAIALLQVATLLLLGLLGVWLALNVWYYLGLALAAVLFIQEQWWIRGRDTNACFRAFKHNHYAGAAVFFGIFISLL